MLLEHKESRKIYRFDDLAYWAENGMITLVDERDGDSRRIPPDKFFDRAQAIGLQARRESHPRERIKFENTANDMEKCILEAIAQGDPTSPEVQKYNARHKKYKKAMLHVDTQSKILLGKRSDLIR